jgi:hypothetical protein
MKELGFTFDQLARSIGRHGKLSPTVCALWDPDLATTDLSQLARFANELTRVMCLGTAAHREAGIALLLMRYGSSVRLTEDSVPALWEQALNGIRAIFDGLGVPIGAIA